MCTVLLATRVPILVAPPSVCSYTECRNRRNERLRPSHADTPRHQRPRPREAGRPDRCRTVPEVEFYLVCGTVQYWHPQESTRATRDAARDEARSCAACPCSTPLLRIESASPCKACINHRASIRRSRTSRTLRGGWNEHHAHKLLACHCR